MTRARTKKYAIEINWRKLVVFASIMIAFVFGWQMYRSSQYSASETELKTNATTTKVSEINLEVKKDGSVYKNGTKVKAKISPQKDYDELRMVVFDKAGFYLDELSVNVKLPDQVASKTSAEIIAEHGVDNTSQSVLDSSTINYDALGVNGGATITVVAKLPKGVIELPLYDYVVYLFSNFGSSVWLILALILPIATIIYLLLLVSFQSKVQKVETPDRPISGPPMALPPAIVGVLLNQKVGAREIAATLVDLAVRRYIFIIDRDRGFSFGRRAEAKGLLGFEQILLAKIFRQSIKASEDQINNDLASHIYSHKMSVFSSSVYNLATQLGYFKVNPKEQHRKFRFIGTVAFFFALGCFFLNLYYFTQVQYAVFFWVGMMIASLVIIILASNMPTRTALGRQSLSNWLAFKMFLSSPEPLPYNQVSYQRFIEYLPYAIVFGCEAMWARRFSDQSFTLPDWFMTEKNGLGLSDFCLALYPIIGYVGQNLSEVREPGYQ